MDIKDILKQPLARKPLTAVILGAPRVQKMFINPVKTVDSFDEAGRQSIETWLKFCAIGTTILDTGTKMLTHKGVIHKRDAVHDIVKAFKDLRGYFAKNKDYEQEEMAVEDFIFSFITMDPQQQKRVMKFQESINK